MNDGAAALVLGRLQHAITRARRLTAGLTDEEFFWEPVEACWSVRPRAQVERGWGAGDWLCEDAWPAPEPLPTTTIAWKVVHLAAWTDIYRSFAFEDGTATLSTAQVPGTAALAVAWLERAQERFIEALGLIGSNIVDELRPAHWGELMPLSSLAGVIELEHIHHGAEISLLRDFHRGSARTVDWPQLPR